MRPVEDSAQLLVVIRGEAVQAQMVSTLDVRLALGNLVCRDPRRREQLHHVRTREALQRAGICDLMYSASDKEKSCQSTCRRVLDHLVDLQFPVPSSGLKKKVM